MNTLIIEDHPVTALGLKMIIKEHFENKKIDIAYHGKEALNKVKKQYYDLITLDITLPNTDTQSLLDNIMRVSSDSEVLVCSNSDPKIYAMPYIGMGASGFIHKSFTEQQLITAINLVLEGQTYVSKEALHNSLSKKGKIRNQNNDLTKQFSGRELEVFTHLLNGKRIKEISKTMHIHQSTASTLKKRVLEKAGVDNLIDLKKKADEFGFS